MHSWPARGWCRLDGSVSGDEVTSFLKKLSVRNSRGQTIGIIGMEQLVVVVGWNYIFQNIDGGLLILESYDLS